MGTRRQARINSRIVRDLSEFIRGIKHDDLGFVTITRCEVAPDLREARVYVSVYGDQAEFDRNLKILETAKGYLRSCLGKSLQTHIVPQLVFMQEKQIATADEMNRLINEARATDPHPDPEPPSAEAENSAEGWTDARPGADEGPIGDFPAGRDDLA